MDNFQKKMTRRNSFDMKAYFDRLLDESDDRSNFPLKRRSNSCDRVTIPVDQMNEAAKRGDWEEVERIRGNVFRALVELEEME